MSSVYDADSAIYINEDKTTIQVNVTEQFKDKGNAVFTRIIEVTPNPVFNDFVEQVSLEKVDENTVKYIANLTEGNREFEKEIKSTLKDELLKELEVNSSSMSTNFNINEMSTEDLFKLKLQAFEIDEVKNSKNRDLKAKIRKANTFLEVLAFTSALINSELNGLSE